MFFIAVYFLIQNSVEDLPLHLVVSFSLEHLSRACFAFHDTDIFEEPRSVSTLPSLPQFVSVFW